MTKNLYFLNFPPPWGKIVRDAHASVCSTTHPLQHIIVSHLSPNSPPHLNNVTIIGRKIWFVWIRFVAIPSLISNPFVKYFFWVWRPTAVNISMVGSVVPAKKQKSKKAAFFKILMVFCFFASAFLLFCCFD